MSIERMTQDGAELTEFLREHLHRGKVFLLGPCWGLILGVCMAPLRPIFSSPIPARVRSDLSRKRSELGRYRSAQILSVQKLHARNLGARARCDEPRTLRPASIDAIELLEEQKQSPNATLAVMRCIDTQISAVERSELAKVKAKADSRR